MTFRAGQKVVCVDAYDASMLALNRVYTVNKISFLEKHRWRGKITEGFSLTLYETAPEPRYSGFAAERFKPLDERKTDISVLTKILNGHPILVD